MSESLNFLFQRDLDKLKEELDLFADEADLWRVEGEIINPAGNLALHLAGNLRHFFGAVLGNTGYERDREAEFGSKHIPRATLLQEIDQAKIDVRKVLEKMNAEDLQSDYPIEIQGTIWTIERFYLSLLAHLNYHLGQINYLRRMLAGQAG